MLVRLACSSCGAEHNPSSLLNFCPSCGGLLTFEYDYGAAGSELRGAGASLGVWRYRALLPPVSSTVSLGEGGTPLVKAERLGRELGLRNLLIKDETRNPTGSFMDRGATVLISKALSLGIKRVVCATTGNLGASLAAYAAKAGLRCEVHLPANVDAGKLYQIVAYGADVRPHGSALESYAAASKDRNFVSTANPHLAEGEKTTTFEVVEQLGRSQPDAIALPVGSGGHLAMAWKALKELEFAGVLGEASARLLAVRSSAYRVFSEAVAGRRRVRVGSDLAPPKPYFAEWAARAVAESGGAAVSVTESEMIEAVGLLARTEGIFAEPAAASVVAGLRKLVELGKLDRNEVVVAVVTGSGLKDPASAARLAKAYAKPVPVPPLPSSRVRGTKFEILEVLATSAPAHGYGIWQVLRERGVSVTLSAVYQNLAWLEARGLVRRVGFERRGGRERVLYALTKRGETVCAAAKK